jgi:hypothetical protein
MALPRYDTTTGRPVYASTGLPAFGCDGPVGDQFEKWRARINCTLNCWIIEKVFGVPPITNPPNTTWNQISSCIWEKWTPVPGPPTDRPTVQTIRGCCGCTSAHVARLYVVSNVASQPCPVHPLAPNTSTTSPDGVYIIVSGGTGFVSLTTGGVVQQRTMNGPPPFPAPGCDNFDSIVTTSLVLQTAGPIFAAPTISGAWTVFNGVVLAITPDPICSRDRDVLFGNHPSNPAGGTVLSRYIYPGDIEGISGDCPSSLGFGPEDFE